MRTKVLLIFEAYRVLNRSACRKSLFDAQRRCMKFKKVLWFCVTVMWSVSILEHFAQNAANGKCARFTLYMRSGAKEA